MLAPFFLFLFPLFSFVSNLAAALPLFPFGPLPEPTNQLSSKMSKPKVFFDITIGGKPAGRIVMELRVSANRRRSRGRRTAEAGRSMRQLQTARRPPPAPRRICSRTGSRLTAASLLHL